MRATLIYHGGPMIRAGGGGGGFGGATGPSEVVVPFSASITIDVAPYASESVYHIAATSNFTLNAPANPVAAKKIFLRILQDGTGGRIITFDSVFRFGVSLPSPILSVSPNLTDYLGFVYNSIAVKWDYIGEAFGL